MNTRAPRFLLAILIAPVAPALLLLLFFAVLMLWDHTVFKNGEGSVVGWTAFVGYLGFVFLGLPAVFILRRAGRLKLWSLLLAGATCGAAALLMFFAAMFGVSIMFSTPLPSAAYVALWGAVPGLIVAFTYWLIATTRHNHTVEKEVASKLAPTPHREL